MIDRATRLRLLMAFAIAAPLALLCVGVLDSPMAQAIGLAVLSSLFAAAVVFWLTNQFWSRRILELHAINEALTKERDQAIFNQEQTRLNFEERIADRTASLETVVSSLRQRTANSQLLQSLSAIANQAQDRTTAVEGAIQRLQAEWDWPLAHYRIYGQAEDGGRDRFQWLWLKDKADKKLETLHFNFRIQEKANVKDGVVWHHLPDIKDELDKGLFTSPQPILKRQVIDHLDHLGFCLIITLHIFLASNRMACIHFLTKDDQAPSPLQIIVLESLGHQLESVFARHKQQNMERALQHSQKLDTLGKLTGGIAHDFNNLLGVIVGNAEMLQLRQGGGQSANIASILRAAGQGSDLVQSLLSFSREMDLLPEQIDPSSFVEEQVKSFGRTFPADIDLEILTEDSTWPCLVDRTELSSAFLNLMINAIQALPEGGDIEISVNDCRINDPLALVGDAYLMPGNYVRIAVKDNGPGMSQTVIDRCIEPFFTTKQMGNGSGLGLSRVFGFTQQSGGGLSILSTQGQGTVASIYLPQALSASEALASQTPGVALSKGKSTEDDDDLLVAQSVLLVEDNDDLRDLVRAMLEKMKGTVSCFPCTQTALDWMEAGNKPDFIFSDIMLPGRMRGDQFAKKVREKHPEIKVILMSGFVENHGLPDPELQAPLLAKPFTLNALKKTIRGLA